MQNRLKKVLFLSLFIILPFLFNPFTGDIELIKVVFLCVATCILLIYAVLFIKKDVKYSKKGKILLYSMLGFTVFASISLFLNDFTISLYGMQGRYMGYIVWFCCVLLAFVVPYYIKNTESLKSLIKTLIWVGFASSIVAILIVFLYSGAVFEGRLSGLTGNPNVLGKLLLFTIVLNFVFLAYPKGKTKFLYIFTLISQLIVFGMTGNRGSWLALGIILLILLLRNPKKYIKYASIALIGAIPFILLIFNRIIDTVSIATRLEIYQKALSKLFERPFFGYGFDFNPEMLIPNEAYTNSVDRAHQLFLDVALNVGIPGLIFFTIFGVMSIYVLIKDKNQYYKAFGYALLALIISLQFSFFTSISLLLFFLCIGIGLQRVLQRKF
ncbi:O-antigen ligase family protein [Patescibacteria group bacterium]